MDTQKLTATEIWNENPRFSEWLARTLTGQEGRLLVAALREVSVPLEDFSSVESIGDPIAKMAMRHMLVSGHQLMVTNLLNMARISYVAPLGNEWEGEG